MQIIEQIQNLMANRSWFLIVVVLLACNPDDFDVVETVEEPIVPEVTYTNALINRIVSNTSNGKIELGCFSLRLPFMLTAKDGTIHTIDQQAAFELLLNDLHSIADFVYPLNIQYDNGTNKEISDAKTLGAAFASCLPEAGWSEDRFPAYSINYENSCYQLVYPLTLSKQDGTMVKIEDEQALMVLLAHETLAFFEFPLQVLNEAGSLIEMLTADQLLSAILGCSGFDLEGFAIEDDALLMECYEIDYPIKVILANGAISNVANHEILCYLMLEGQIYDFVYPYHLIDSVGTKKEIASEYHLETALWECPDYEYIGDELYILYLGAAPWDRGACFKIKFPVVANAVPFDTGSPINVRITNIDRMADVIFNNRISQPVYPITLSLLPSRTEVVVRNFSDLQAIMDNCF